MILKHHLQIVALRVLYNYNVYWLTCPTRM